MQLSPIDAILYSLQMRIGSSSLPLNPQLLSLTDPILTVNALALGMEKMLDIYLIVSRQIVVFLI